MAAVTNHVRPITLDSRPELVLAGLLENEKDNLALSRRTLNEINRLYLIYCFLNNQILSFNEELIGCILFTEIPKENFGRELTGGEQCFIDSIARSDSRQSICGKITLKEALKNPIVSRLLGEYTLCLLVNMGKWPVKNGVFHREEFATMALDAHQRNYAANQALFNILSASTDPQYDSMKEACKKELEEREKLIEALKMNQKLLEQFPTDIQKQIQKLQIQIAKDQTPSLEEIQDNNLKV